MTLQKKSVIREVYYITDNEKQSIKDFLQGAVYCWCKNRKDKWFSLRDLMGGENFYWEGTPLIALYNKYKEDKGDEAVAAAGKDAGWLLKRVLDDDKRMFDDKKEDLIRKYCWIGEEE